MARDVLLLLLVVGVVLTLALLAIAAIAASRRAAGTRDRARPLPPVRDRRHSVPPSYRAPRPAAPREPSTAAPTVQVAALPAAMSDQQLPEPPSPADQAAASVTPVGVPSRPASTGARRRSGRPRRFTLPDMTEDHDRVGRSIAAFLGEPIAHSATGRQRRRHRARRPAGSPVPRSDLVLFVDGSPRDPRLGRAVATALRASTRESDEIVELQGGRLRVTLEADDAGSEAFVRRAREVVRPWLDVLGAGLDLHVDAQAPTNGGSSAAS